MKKIIALLALIASFGLNAQNLIENPGFEDGTVPTLPSDYVYNFQDNVPFWRNGCDTEPVLGLLLTPDIHTVGAPDCWWDAPSNSHTTNLPVNFAGTSRYAFCGYSQSQNLKESVIGTLNQSLTAGTYKISLYGSKVPGKGYCPGGSNTTYDLSDPGADIEVVLRKSSDICGNSSAVLWTSPEITTIGSWSYEEGLITVDCSIAAEGYDRIEFRMKTAEDVHGVFLDDVSLEKVDLRPVIYGGTNLCSNYPLTFSGAILSGANCMAHLWEIQECTSNGTLIGLPLHSNWVSGNPGSYTFPNSLNLPCNRYYRIKLAPSNNVSCEWVEATKIIRLNCSPVIDPIPNQSICLGSSATFNITTTNWPVKVYDGPNLVGTYYSNPIILSPNSTTTYSFVTENKFRCEDAQAVTVDVRECPVPCFEFIEPLRVDTVNTKFGPMPVAVYCLPNEAFIDGSCSMFEDGYHIRVSEIDVQNWVLNPDLYNGWVSASGQVPSSINLNALVSPNNFTLNQIYYIGLTVGPGWNTGTGQLFMFIEDCDIKSGERRSTSIPDITDVDIYPNPSSGYFTIETNSSELTTFQIVDATGKLIQNGEFQSRTEIDFTKIPSGLYFVKVNNKLGEQVEVQKVVIK